MRKTIGYFWPIIFSLGIVLWPGNSGAVEKMDLPIQLQFKLLIKAATYNRAQSIKDPEVLRVGLVYSQQSNSQQVAQEVFALFGTVETKVRQYKLAVVPIEFQNTRQFKQDTEGSKIHIYYITPGSTSHLASILDISNQLKILTMTGISEYVHQGVALGVANSGSRPEFIYNGETARNSGADFHSNFLRLVRVIRR
ncbi:MAG: YfiR family protein [SAR324 cluster bacterium]|nr:YfiR family protein [SAR324 cluster bacterium]